MEQIYIKVKRDIKTFFFEVNQADKVEVIKTKLQEFFKKENIDMRLYISTRLLDDSSTLSDQNIQNDSTLSLYLRKQTGDFDGAPVET